MARAVMKFKDRPGDERTVHRKTRLLMVTVDYRPIHQMNIMDGTGRRGKMPGHNENKARLQRLKKYRKHLRHIFYHR